MKCYTCARTLKNEYPDSVTFDEKTDFKVFFQAQWDNYLKDLQNEKKGDFYQHKGNLIVFVNDSLYVGSMDNFLEWATQEYRYIDNTSMMIYKKMATDGYKNCINSTPGRSFVFMDITYGDVSVPEKVIIELFEDVCPITCNNFKELCKGHMRQDKKNLCYTGTYFDRIVRGQYIQGGNIGNVLDDGKGKLEMIDNLFSQGTFLNLRPR
jgi:hypothetical protein